MSGMTKIMQSRPATGQGTRGTRHTEGREHPRRSTHHRSGQVESAAADAGEKGGEGRPVHGEVPALRILAVAHADPGLQRGQLNAFRASVSPAAARGLTPLSGHVNDSNARRMTSLD